MTPLPTYLIISLKEPLRELNRLAKNSELPTIDVDAVLSGMTEVLEHPNLTGRGLRDAVHYLLITHGLSDLHLEIEDTDEAEACFYTCLIIMRQDLQALNPYIDGKLPYRYKERHGQHAVIFEKFTPSQ